MNYYGYEDILAPRRVETSNWLWTQRTLNIKFPITRNPRPTPESLKMAVLKSLKIQNLINEISKNQGIPRKLLEKEIIDILNEIGYKKNLTIIRQLGVILTKICLKVCSGVYVNYTGISELKSRIGNCPVVFVPSHRSYADFIMFSYICFNYDLEIPAIAAATDFHGMMGIGELLRYTGAFYLKRSNTSDIYWQTFKQYIDELVTHGDEPIEFFIEGTRSRTNKSLTPKFGLLTMILKSFFLRQVPDILFVPVSINYDRILEENLFSFELLGIPKPKETTSGFFKSLKIMKEHFGNIYIHFDKPISAKQFFMDNSINNNNNLHNFGPLNKNELSEQEKKCIPLLANEIVQQQQDSMILNYFNLIALILNNNLTKGQRLLSIQELENDIIILKNHLQTWNAIIFDYDIQQAIKDNLIVHQNLIYETNKKIGIVSNKVIVDRVDTDKLKAHNLSQDIINYSVPFIMLQIYVNPVLHHLIDSALIVIILRSFSGITKDSIFNHFLFLRKIFHLEFVLKTNHYQMHFEKAIQKLLESKIITLENDIYNLDADTYFEDILISSIQPFILTYFVVSEVLQKLPEIVDEKSILSNVQALIENAIKEKKIFIHPYCMCLDALSNCLNSFSNMSFLYKDKQNGKVIYRIHKQRIIKLKENLEIYIPSFHVIKSFQLFLHMRSKM